MDSVGEIKAIVIVLRNGLVVASKIRDKNTEEDLVAATTSVFDILIKRLKKDYGNAEKFINIMTLNQNKFLFAAAGENAILSIVANLKADDKKLKIYGEHVAKKVMHLNNDETIDTFIPQTVHLLANARSSFFPTGTFIKKIVFLGDSRVGKTSIIKSFIDRKFDDTYLPTLGMDISEKKISIETNCILDLKIWELEGQHHASSSLRKRFFLDAALAFIIFDFTRKETFTNLKKWINLFQQKFNEEIPFIILGNKSDLPHPEILPEDIELIQKEINSLIFSVSAKNQNNIDEAFKFASYKIFDMI